MFDDLQILNGGVVSNYTGVVGYKSAGSNNTALVSGTGSLWKSGNALFVGYESSVNWLVISNGGMVVGVGQIGSCGSSNSVLVIGTGSVWSNTSIFILVMQFILDM